MCSLENQAQLLWWSNYDQVILLEDRVLVCLSLEDNTLCWATFDEVTNDLWLNSVCDNGVYIEELSHTSLE